MPMKGHELISAEQFRLLAEQQLARLPRKLHEAIENVVIFVEEAADAKTLEALGIDDPGELLGLYQGWPLPDRGTEYAGHLPDMIHLYRQPILAHSMQTGESVAEVIRSVLMHEIGHYFGFSDEEMERIGH